MSRLTETARDEDRLRHRISAGSQNPEDYVDLAGLVADRFYYDEAINLYETAIALISTSIWRARVSVDLGWVLFEANQCSKAEELADKIVSLVVTEPTSSEVLFIKGSAQALLAHCAWSRNPDRAAESARLAIESLRQLMAEDPQFGGLASAYCLAARVQLLLGNAADAISLTENCLALALTDGDRQICLRIRAEALRNEDRLDEAQQTLKEALHYAETDQGSLAELYFELGSIQRLTNCLTDAKESFQKALRIVTSPPKARASDEFLAEIQWNLGSIYYDLGEYMQARAAYEEVIERSDQNAALRSDAMLWLGHCLYRSGNYSEAHEAYLNFLAPPQTSEERRAEASEGLAKASYQSGNYRQALMEFDKALLYYPEANPYHFTILISLGNCLEGLGKFEQARDYFTRVLASPRAATADKDSARRCIIESRGKLSYESRQYEEAAAAFEEAALCYHLDEPHRFNILLWLGNSYEGSGNHLKAQRCFETVLTSPHASEADKVSAQEGLSRLFSGQRR
jgi:tetratricopeptide (TPR) repeat protein